MNKATHYEVLNVPAQVTPDELKKSYRVLLLSTHPDKSNVTTSKYSIDQIKEAYRILSDPVSRKTYDAHLLEEGKKNGFYNVGDALDEVSLDSFACHENEDLMEYTMKCPRCQVKDGFKLNDDILDEFAVSCNERDQGLFQVLVQCDSCSLWLKVNFYALESEE
ncbi:hypothetical protein KAFR_0G00910 [Kazachstania africana CBS 2517]|uniref:Diphthamide biosynthesis protein 4 n=1 Tax=Kazachstania africana (strain ATCC 22294 / BCRC 22015 / CBS 2517 / CECT 1963 / NBRC 1671 / NRRL Y-8276) TaxID=1071382 RepID=H2AXM4_KAZAF|nr:hypothetical protein KAFR_0G00910 [Kazachstania africana CBS 2517]CCF59124.1 hypothetical protein KAFR_0G00910 [Kazachstania africana CBS 2517]